MSQRSPQTQDLPLKMVGGCNFGRYPKISDEKTFNMIVSDDFLVDSAGYQSKAVISQVGAGRGTFNSTRLNKLIVVIYNKAYTVSENLEVTLIGTLQTNQGVVYISENNNNQISICDQTNILYVWDTVNSFEEVDLGFVANYIAFQDTYTIASVADKPQWRLSDQNDSTTWPSGGRNVGEFQTKADNCVAVVPFPGRGGQLLVMGSVVTETWSDVGGPVFPYKRSVGFNIDYGCVSATTVAQSENFVIWLGRNEKSGPVIMLTSGGDVQKISNDGIDFLFSTLKNPEQSYGFLFMQDGHLIYQLTFTDPEDNFTLAYDFKTQLFFFLTDEDQNYHIATRVSFFNDSYYFVSVNNGNLYELNTKYTTYDGLIIPRIRICPTIRLNDSSPFIANNLTFVMEQGDDAGTPFLDMAISRDGGSTYGNFARTDLNTLGKRRNRVVMWNMGYANEFTHQFRFYVDGRVIVGNGTLGIYQ